MLKSNKRKLTSEVEGGREIVPSGLLTQPLEIIELILMRLETSSLCQLSQTCHFFHSMLNDPAVLNRLVDYHTRGPLQPSSSLVLSEMNLFAVGIGPQAQERGYWLERYDECLADFRDSFDDLSFHFYPDYKVEEKRASCLQTTDI